MIVEQRREIVHSTIDPQTGLTTSITYGMAMVSVQKDRSITGDANAICVDGRWYIPANPQDSHAIQTRWRRAGLQG